MGNNTIRQYGILFLDFERREERIGFSMTSAFYFLRICKRTFPLEIFLRLSTSGVVYSSKFCQVCTLLWSFIYFICSLLYNEEISEKSLKTGIFS